jgi:type I site-specific restriction-modification system R (restriction) subunit
VVQKIDENSQQLALALKTGVPIVIAILQKFPFVTGHIGELPDRRYAVIVDEAHSSQSGQEAVKMKAVLAAPRIKEQTEIATRINDENNAALKEAAILSSSIALLREYRSALISAAVTGQLDIRQHQKQLEALA